MKYAFILIAIVLMAACSSPKNMHQADFEPIESQETPTRGIYYHLPATVLKIEITAQKTVKKRGPFFRYSQRYLNLSDIITEDHTEWEITGAKIHPGGIPDPERLFHINSAGTPSGAAVSLTPEGVLAGLNIADADISSQAEKKTTIEKKTTSIDDVFFDDTPFTEEQLRKTSGAATAEEVAAEIYRLRDSRRRLLESDMQVLPPDDGAYRRILKGIDQMEEQYLSLFKGKRETETVKKTFTFRPDPSAPANQVLLRFSSRNGFTEIADMAGTPVYIDIRTDSIPRVRNAIQTATEEERAGGLIYCKPAKTTVKIIDRTILLSEKEVMIGQFGTLHRLPAALLDSPETSVKLDVNTGALREIRTKP